MTARDFIVKDHAARKGKNSYVSYNWYRAEDPEGLTVTFRFVKGGDRKSFDAFVATNQLTEIEGPFKTRNAAHIG